MTAQENMVDDGWHRNFDLKKCHKDYLINAAMKDYKIKINPYKNINCTKLRNKSYNHFRRISGRRRIQVIYDAFNNIGLL